MESGSREHDQALLARRLRKRFGATVAVQELDLEVPPGSFFGLVGPNGAGKTTTLRMATGLLRPDGGRVWVSAVDVWADPVRAKALIGVVPEELRLFERLTGRELVVYNGLLRGLPAELVEGRTSELLDILGLGQDGDVLVADYSHGMRKKIALAAALLHAPRTLFLDEPFEAVDPVSARVVRSLLEDHVRHGGTVVFSSHVMALVEALCDRVAVMHRGRVVAAGRLAEVAGGRSLEDAFIELVGAGDAAAGRLAWLGSSST